MAKPVSIVTVTFDTLFFVRLLVEKVRQFVGQRDYEVIAVDRGSRDGTREWVEQQADVRLISTNASNRGHAHGEAAELGAKAARYETIVLLDSDAHPIDSTWLLQTADQLDKQQRLAGAVFHGRHEGNPYGWYIHPHFMVFHSEDLGGKIILRKINANFDTAEESTVRMLNAGLGVIGYPLVLCKEFSVGHPVFPTVAAGVFHAWYGTRLAKETQAVGRETEGAVTSATYLAPLQERLRQAYRLTY
jgi:glycosyltransferase involved in cell wall biosynthesis